MARSRYVTSTVQLNMAKIHELNANAVKALELTAEALHTDVVNSGVMPRDTGHMEDDATFVDYSDSNAGKVRIVTATPYARRLYYHPEYHFQKHENAFAQGKWYKPWLKGGAYEDKIQKNYAKILRQLMK